MATIEERRAALLQRREATLGRVATIQSEIARSTDDLYGGRIASQRRRQLTRQRQSLDPVLRGIERQLQELREEERAAGRATITGRSAAEELQAGRELSQRADARARSDAGIAQRAGLSAREFNRYTPEARRAVRSQVQRYVVTDRGLTPESRRALAFYTYVPKSQRVTTTVDQPLAARPGGAGGINISGDFLAQNYIRSATRRAAALDDAGFSTRQLARSSRAGLVIPTSVVFTERLRGITPTVLETDREDTSGFFTGGVVRERVAVRAETPAQAALLGRATGSRSANIVVFERQTPVSGRLERGADRVVNTYRKLSTGLSADALARRDARDVATLRRAAANVRGVTGAFGEPNWLAPGGLRTVIPRVADVPATALSFTADTIEGTSRNPARTAAIIGGSYAGGYAFGSIGGALRLGATGGRTAALRAGARATSFGLNTLGVAGGGLFAYQAGREALASDIPGYNLALLGASGAAFRGGIVRSSNRLLPSEVNFRVSPRDARSFTVYPQRRGLEVLPGAFSENLRGTASFSRYGMRFRVPFTSSVRGGLTPYGRVAGSDPGVRLVGAEASINLRGLGTQRVALEGFASNPFGGSLTRGSPIPYSGSFSRVGFRGRGGVYVTTSQRLPGSRLTTARTTRNNLPFVRETIIQQRNGGRIIYDPADVFGSNSGALSRPGTSFGPVGGRPSFISPVAGLAKSLSLPRAASLFGLGAGTTAQARTTSRGSTQAFFGFRSLTYSRGVTRAATSSVADTGGVSFADALSNFGADSVGLTSAGTATGTGTGSGTSGGGGGGGSPSVPVITAPGFVGLPFLFNFSLGGVRGRGARRGGSARRGFAYTPDLPSLALGRRARGGRRSGVFSGFEVRGL